MLGGKALTGLGAKKKDLPLYDRYLARVPNDDTVVSPRAKAASNIKKAARGGGGRRDVRGEARAKGFKLLEQGDTEGAPERFEFALRGNRHDADSLGGIGIILLQQNRFAEAEDYLARAANRSKRSRAKWEEALSSARLW